MKPKYDPNKLTVNAYDYSEWYTETSDDLSSMPLLQSDEEEAKEGTLIKILTPNKLLNKLPVLLAHIKLEIIQKTKKRNQENSACTLSTR